MSKDHTFHLHQVIYNVYLLHYLKQKLNLLFILHERFVDCFPPVCVNGEFESSGTLLFIPLCVSPPVCSNDSDVLA